VADDRRIMGGLFDPVWLDDLARELCQSESERLRQIGRVVMTLPAEERLKFATRLGIRYGPECPRGGD